MDRQAHYLRRSWVDARRYSGRFSERISDRFRRIPATFARFALMGSVGSDDSELFEILDHTNEPIVASSSGEFCSFANDVKRLYGNNGGSLRFSVKRVG